MFKLSLGPHPNLPLEREFQNMHPGLQSISYLLLMECICYWSLNLTNKDLEKSVYIPRFIVKDTPNGINNQFQTILRQFRN
jgi:hypothetical protein